MRSIKKSDLRKPQIAIWAHRNTNEVEQWRINIRFQSQFFECARLKMAAFAVPINVLERETGFEPATSTLARWSSTTELFPRVFHRSYWHGL